VKTTGKVLFTLGSADYVCSGSLAEDNTAGRALVLSAGHCVYDDADDVFATNWMFIPEFEAGGDLFNCRSTTKWGCWTATALVTTQGFADSDLTFDVGFAVLGLGGNSNLQADEVLGDQRIVFNQKHPSNVYAFGYPHAFPYDGTDLIYCNGRDKADAFGSGDYGLRCDMTGGSSGGPWFVKFNTDTGEGRLNSVNSFKYSIDPNTMYGPYFGSEIETTYNTAKTTSGNTVVAP
jgi:hypothetical protein